MARRSLLAENEEATEINLSPMIDCIFILLIFFIVTTVFVEESGLPVNKPDAAAAAAANDEENVTVVLEITPEGKVLFEGKEIPLSDIKSRVKGAMKDADTPVIIRANEHAKHGVFMTVWDQAKLAGAEQLSFSTVN